MSLPRLYAFTNTHLLSEGQALPNDIYFSPDTGLITPNYTRSRPEISDSVVKIDLKGEYVVAPGFLECQINGIAGVHFTTLGKSSEDNRTDTEDDEVRLRKVARALVKTGVTGFLATVPTVEKARWKEILPVLRPRCFSNAATLLGAHVEGPYLHPTKNGAHNPSFFQEPSNTLYTDLYGDANVRTTIKLITLAPELPGAIDLIKSIRQSHPHIAISLGHSSATYDEGQTALRAGARGLTHVYNAMNPLHHRDPGLPGLLANNPSSSMPKDPMSSQSEHLLSSSMSVTDWLARQMGHLDPSQAGTNGDPNAISKQEVYFSLIPDLIHVHPSVLAMSQRTAPHRAILITDAIELASLPDGEYPPNDQITHRQVKKGDRATIAGTDTLIGSCTTMDQGVRNMVERAGCTLAEAVRCVTENVRGYLGQTVEGRGRLDIGCRADLVVMDRKGNVVQTWIGGVKVFDVDDPSVGEGEDEGENENDDVELESKT